MATITVTQDHNFTNETPLLIDQITFNTANLSAAATFTSAQFFAGGIANNVLITGDSKQDVIFVNMSSPGAFSAAGWQFSNWSGSDYVGIQGTSGADIITPPSASGGRAVIGGGAGADILYANSAGTTFQYNPGDIQAGEQVIGGAGTDSLFPVSFASAPVYDFSLATLSSIEFLDLNIGTVNGMATVILKGTQIGAGHIATVYSGAVFHDTLIVKGGAVDLSGVDFQVWTNNDDFIRIIGTKRNNTLIGGSQDDDIVGGRGRDHLTGGDGADTFIFKSKMDSLKGAAHRDVIQDFVQGSDLIDLHKIDANANKAGNQTFHFIDAQHFHHKAGELRVTHNAVTDIAIISGDTNGDGKADFQIQVHSPVPLLATDLML